MRDFERETKGRHEFLVIALIVFVLFMLGHKASAEEIATVESHTWYEEFAASESGPAKHWPAPTAIEHNPAGSPLTSTEAVAMLQYAAWSWPERTGLQVTYSGITESTGGAYSGKITVSWIDAFEMADTGRGFLTKGYTRTHYYPSTGEIVGAEIYLNSTILNDADSCTTQAAMHEIGHAIGSNHTSSRDDVMYTYGATGCRYAPSVNDVAQLQYGDNTCYAELTNENDLYIPMIDGKAALLVFDGVDGWKLKDSSVSAGTCSTVKLESDKDLIFSDVRARGMGFSRVELDWTGDVTGKDTWKLRYAE